MVTEREQRREAVTLDYRCQGMGFFARLFGKATPGDQTKDWPPAAGPSPQMNVERRALESFGGRVTLGDRIDAARVLGRPDTVEAFGAWTILRYENWGLVLEFEEQQLFSVEFLVRERESGPSRSVDAVEPLGPDQIRLTRKTTKPELLERFGPPHGDHDYSGAGQILYIRPPMVLSYVVDEEQQLVAWKVSANI